MTRLEDPHPECPPLPAVQAAAIDAVIANSAEGESLPLPPLPAGAHAARTARTAEIVREYMAIIGANVLLAKYKREGLNVDKIRREGLKAWSDVTRIFGDVLLGGTAAAAAPKPDSPAQNQQFATPALKAHANGAGPASSTKPPATTGGALAPVDELMDEFLVMEEESKGIKREHSEREPVVADVVPNTLPTPHATDADAEANTRKYSRNPRKRVKDESEPPSASVGVKEPTRRKARTTQKGGDHEAEALPSGGIPVSGTSDPAREAARESGDEKKKKLPLQQQKSGPLVAFTLADKIVPKHVEVLGAQITEDPLLADYVVVGDNLLKRTVKVMAAMARGAWILSIDWADDCLKAEKLLDPAKYVLRDIAFEGKHDFSLKKTLEVARSRKLLEGVTVYGSPSAKRPDAHEMETIVTAAGGNFVREVPKTAPPAKDRDFVVVVTAGDSVEAAAELAGRGFSCVESEFLMSGIIQQRLDWEAHAWHSTQGSSSSAGEQKAGKARATRRR